MITVISKFLPLLTMIPAADTILLKNIHLIELIRYHRDRLKTISNHEISVPEGFQSGLDIGIGETHHLYRFMCLWFELESLIKTGRSFLDFFWRTIAIHNKDAQKLDDIKNQRYLSQAMNKLGKKGDCDFKKTATYKYLEHEWLSWGAYLIRFRNYLEYGQPLGGMLRKAVGSIIQTNNHIDITIPDNFPSYGEDIDNYNFTFNNNKKVLNFANSVVSGIDRMFPEIIEDNT